MNLDILSLTTLTNMKRDALEIIDSDIATIQRKRDARTMIAEINASLDRTIGWIEKVAVLNGTPIPAHDVEEFVHAYAEYGGEG